MDAFGPVTLLPVRVPKAAWCVGGVDTSHVIAAASIITADLDVCPVWLRDGLHRAAISISMAARQEEQFPTRAQLRSRLEALSVAAAVVAAGLNDASLLSFLDLQPASNEDEEGYARLSDCNAAQHTMVWIAEQAKKQAAAIRVGAGSDKHYPQPNGLSALNQCTSEVINIWLQIHSALPKHSDSRLHNTCEHLWCSARADRIHYGNTFSGGKDHIKDILPLKLDLNRIMRVIRNQGMPDRYYTLFFPRPPEKLRDLMQQAVPDLPITFRSRSGNILGYACGRPFASLSRVGLALEMSCASFAELLATTGARRLNYKPAQPSDRSYVMVPDITLSNTQLLRAWIMCSISSLPETKPRRAPRAGAV